MKYQIDFKEYFIKKYKKLIKNNNKLKDKISVSIKKLSVNPKDNSLKSHKVDSRYFDNVFSSSVTGDIRIIWRYGDNKEIEIIELLDLGGHDGGSGVYR